MDTVAFDWDHGKVTAFDGEKILTFPDLEVFVESLDEPHRLVGETSYESFDVVKRRQIRRRCEVLGHEFYTIHPRLTRKIRKEWDVEKSDEQDARIIYYLAAEKGVPLREAREPDDERIAWAEAVRHKAMVMRRREDRVALGEEILEALNVFSAADDYKKYLTPAVTTMFAFVAQSTDDRDEYTRVLGAHGNGHANILRADLLWFGWGSLKKRDEDVSRGDFQLAYRWLFHKVKQLQTMVENGEMHIPAFEMLNEYRPDVVDFCVQMYLRGHMESLKRLVGEVPDDLELGRDDVEKDVPLPDLNPLARRVREARDKAVAAGTDSTHSETDSNDSC